VHLAKSEEWVGRFDHREAPSWRCGATPWSPSRNVAVHGVPLVSARWNRGRSRYHVAETGPVAGPPRPRIVRPRVTNSRNGYCPVSSRSHRTTVRAPARRRITRLGRKLGAASSGDGGYGGGRPVRGALQQPGAEEQVLDSSLSLWPRRAWAVGRSDARSRSRSPQPSTLKVTTRRVRN